ncbi:uncharacterized protein EAE98_004367 [Botrytis deweyae]|uniref:Uncharacterized protein n=1 Tax=Botrytis deweyae TaxID=2478750 RepID=A0ABQ7IQP8_9HELO|nr:uncharacterized protein EAE98_004367 [Botrytis deweyae]KAF7931631.1 hypothetical protein EAE98_004367 [Botrytis deweyae]
MRKSITSKILEAYARSSVKFTSHIPPKYPQHHYSTTRPSHQIKSRKQTIIMCERTTAKKVIKRFDGAVQIETFSKYVDCQRKHCASSGSYNSSPPMGSIKNGNGNTDAEKK